MRVEFYEINYRYSGVEDSDVYRLVQPVVLIHGGAGID